MDIHELLGITKEQTVAVNETTEAPEQLTLDPAPPELDTDKETDNIIAGMEGLISLLGRPNLMDMYPLKNLSGCESFANGIMYSNGDDLTQYAGNEGFVDSVVNGFKSVIKWIKDGLKSIWDFFFGKNNAEKANASMKEYNDVAKEVGELLNNAKTPEEREALRSSVLEMAKAMKKSLEDTDEHMSKKDVMEINLGGDRKKSIEILGKFIDGKTTVDVFWKDLCLAINPIGNIMTKVSEDLKKNIKKTETSVNEVESKVNGLKEGEDAKKKEVKEKLEEQRGVLANIKEGGKEIQNGNKMIHQAKQIGKTIKAKVKKK